MQNERQRILELVEKGTISAQEAITLLEALEQSGKSTQNVMDDVSKESQSFSSDKESLFEEKTKDGDKKKEDFMKHFQDEMQDFRKDLTQIGSLFMDMMNTAVKKVKEFDVASPFGDKFEFTHTEEVAAANVESIIAELPMVTFLWNPVKEIRFKLFAR